MNTQEHFEDILNLYKTLRNKEDIQDNVQVFKIIIEKIHSISEYMTPEQKYYVHDILHSTKTNVLQVFNLDEKDLKDDDVEMAIIYKVTRKLKRHENKENPSKGRDDMVTEIKELKKIITMLKNIDGIYLNSIYLTYNHVFEMINKVFEDNLFFISTSMHADETESRIDLDEMYETLMDEIHKYKNKCGIYGSF